MDKNEVADTVRRAADGDRGAWEAIVEDFSGLLWSVCRGYRLEQSDAAEVVQTTWLRLLENIDGIREPERLGGWLATTARREALRLHRLHGRELTTDDETRFDQGPLDAVLDPATGRPARRPRPAALAGVRRAAGAMSAAAAVAGRRRPELRRGGRDHGHADRQHRPDPGPLPATTAPAAGRAGSQRRGRGVVR